MAVAGGTDEFPPHLQVVRQLGRGAYGTVYLCDDTRNGKQVAVKHIRHAARHGKSILREVILLARLKHENLLHLIDFPAVSGPDFEDVYLVLPYFPADLHKVIQSKQSLSDKHVQVIICQILRALFHLHGAGVAHRDLKPANILISSDCKLKVCDFGLARGDMVCGDDEGSEDGQACGVLTEYVVTRWYRAPEIMLLPKHYTSTVDLWSVGCILGEICGRRALFPGKNHVDMIVRVAQVLGTPSDDELNWLPKNSDAYRFVRRVCPRSEGIPLSTLYPKASSACLDMLRALLGWDPARRLTAAEAQEHEYLKSFLPKEKAIPPQPFDWSFDGFKPTTNAVKERLYKECTRYHPEMLERDRPRRPSRLAPETPSARSAALVAATAAVAAAASAPQRPDSGRQHRPDSARQNRPDSARQQRVDSGVCTPAFLPRPPSDTNDSQPSCTTSHPPDNGRQHSLDIGGQHQQCHRQDSGSYPSVPTSLSQRGATPAAAVCASSGYPQQHQQHQQLRRQMSAGCPPGPPASRMDTATGPPLSAKSSPGCRPRNLASAEYLARAHDQRLSRDIQRSSAARYQPLDSASSRSSPHESYLAPPRSVVPQPHFATRSAHVPHPVRSLTPPRVLAR